MKPNSKVLKFPIEIPDGGGRVRIQVPVSAEFLAVANQREQLVAWYLIYDEPNPKYELITLVVALTGRPCVLDFEDPECRRYMGTVMFDGGDFVLHVFEEFK